MTWVSTELTSVLAAFPLATLALPFLKSQITSVSMMVCGDTFTTSLAAESSLKLWLRWRRRRRLNFWRFLMREGYLPSSPCKDLQDNRQCLRCIFTLHVRQVSRSIALMSCSMVSGPMWNLLKLWSCFREVIQIVFIFDFRQGQSLEVNLEDISSVMFFILKQRSKWTISE